MCIGEPALLRSRNGIAGVAEIDGQDVLVDLSLVPDAEPGTWLLCFLGAARAVIEERFGLRRYARAEAALYAEVVQYG